MNPEFFNQMTTLHGLIMVFGAIMPAFVGFANWQIPMMIGAPDMAFPRMNNWSFWLLPLAASLLVISSSCRAAPRRRLDAVSAALHQMGMGMDLAIFAVHILGMSSIMGSINIVTTILNLRAPGMTLMKMPLFVWTWLITAYLLIAVMPVLAGAVTMMLTDRHFGTSFFNAAGGGDPVMFQHIFWFFGHPEVYIMIIAGLRRGFPGDPGLLAQAPVRLCLDGVCHRLDRHPVVPCLGPPHVHGAACRAAGQLYFMYATMLIAVPTGVKVFNWVATMWKGSMTFETPMLFAVGFMFLFTMGGFTGLVLAITPVDIQMQDTYYVVAHFHYVMVAGALFSAFAGAYFWLPKWTGRMYDETLGKWHFWLSMIFFNITFFVQHFPRPWPACRGASPTTRCSSPTSTRSQHRRLRFRAVTDTVPVHRVEDDRQAARRRHSGRGKARIPWSGPCCRRRRPTTASRRRRW